MTKRFLYTLSMILTASGIFVMSVDAASINAKEDTGAVIPFANLTDYQILLTGSENGISTYSGVKNNIRLTFQADSKEINKITIAFDYQDSADKSADIAEIINISNKIFPGKISDEKIAGENLEDKLSAMNSARDEDIFNIDQLRIEAHINNGMVNLRITR